MFFRLVLYLLLAVVLITVVRMVVGVAVKFLGSLFSAANTVSASQQNGKPGGNIEASGELHRDPVCGTFVSENTRYQRRVSSQNFYYCSEDCRQKHALVAR